MTSFHRPFERVDSGPAVFLFGSTAGLFVVLSRLANSKLFLV
jgi:hypothetical protein